MGGVFCKRIHVHDEVEPEKSEESREKFWSIKEWVLPVPWRFKSYI